MHLGVVEVAEMQYGLADLAALGQVPAGLVLAEAIDGLLLVLVEFLHQFLVTHGVQDALLRSGEEEQDMFSSNSSRNILKEGL